VRLRGSSVGSSLVRRQRNSVLFSSVRGLAPQNSVPLFPLPSSPPRSSIMSVQAVALPSPGKSGPAAPAASTPLWFRLFQVYAIATLFIEVVLEFPKLARIINFDIIYTLFPPLAKGPVTNSPRWWVSGETEPVAQRLGTFDRMAHRSAHCCSRV
jgi:hypothetical protein